MSKMKYWQQLKDPRWQEKRLNILKRANFACENCCAKPEGESLAIHHKYYQQGLMAWEYPDKSLLCLCKVCHEEVARVERVFLETIPGRDAENLLELAFAVHKANERDIGVRLCAKAIFNLCNAHDLRVAGGVELRVLEVVT